MSSREASARTAPPPAQMSGLLAPRNSAAARRTWSQSRAAGTGVGHGGKRDVGGGGQDIGGNFHLRGARTTSPHLAHGFVNSARDGGHIVDALAPLGDRPDDVDLVVNLVQGATITPDVITLDLSGQEQDRRRRCVGCAQRRAGVLDTRSRHHEGHAWLAQ